MKMAEFVITVVLILEMETLDLDICRDLLQLLNMLATFAQEAHDDETLRSQLSNQGAASLRSLSYALFSVLSELTDEQRDGLLFWRDHEHMGLSELAHQVITQIEVIADT